MSDQAVREHVLDLLRGGGAHLHFDRAIAGLPEDLRGAKVDGVPHTAWRLLELKERKSTIRFNAGRCLLVPLAYHAQSVIHCPASPPWLCTSGSEADKPQLTHG